MHVLRDGSFTLDRRLDVIFDKDPQNRDFPATAVMPDQVVHVSKAWQPGPVTDQGKEGACVGHGLLGCLMCEPHHFDAGADPTACAFELYHAVQDGDDWEGCVMGPQCPNCPAPETYGGTSLKAGGKVAAQRGMLTEYRWAFGLDEALASLATLGPIVLAIPWFESMYEADNGLVVVSGQQVGRHCIQVPQVDFEAREVEWQNSWGLAYGKNGRARVPFDTLDQLLKADGEVLVPVR